MGKPDIMTNMAIRTRLMIDASPEYTRQVKLVVLNNNMKSYRELFMKTLAERYPELKEVTDKELR